MDIKRGNAILTGRVPSLHEKLMAEEIVMNVQKIKAVKNQLEVALMPLPHTPPDVEIQDKVKRVLASNQVIKMSKIHVIVLSGWVTLGGTVDALWKKRRAENDITEVAGVQGVTNKLAIVPSESRKDELIAVQIVDFIDQNDSANVGDVNVIVEEGVVTLTGTVPSWSVANIIQNKAHYSLDVFSVINRLEVRRA